MKKFFSTGLMFIMLLTLLAGCGKTQTVDNEGDMTENETKSQTDQETKNSDDEKVTITVWHMLEPGVVDAIKNAYAVFEQANPNIKVKFERQENFGDKVSLLVGQNNVNVDLIAAPHDWVGKYAAMGVIEDVEGKIDEKVLEQLIPATVEAVKYEDKLYGVPSTLETVALLYNTELISEPPKTTNELLELAKTETHDGQYGFLMVPFDAYINSGWIYGYDGAYLTEDGKSALDDPDNIEAVKFLQKLGEYYPKDLEYSMVNELFKQGRAAAILAGPWSIADIKSSGINYKMATLPAISDKNNAQAKPFMSVQTMLLLSGSGHKEEAIKVMAFYGSEEVAKSLALSAGSIPANERAYEIEEVKNNIDLMGFMEQSKLGIPMPNIPEMGGMWEPIKQTLLSAVVLKEDPEASLNKWHKEAEKNIENMQ